MTGGVFPEPASSPSPLPLRGPCFLIRPSHPANPHSAPLGTHNAVLVRGVKSFRVNQPGPALINQIRKAWKKTRCLCPPNGGRERRFLHRTPHAATSYTAPRPIEHA